MISSVSVARQDVHSESNMKQEYTTGQSLRALTVVPRGTSDSRQWVKRSCPSFTSIRQLFYSSFLASWPKPTSLSLNCSHDLDLAKVSSPLAGYSQFEFARSVRRRTCSTGSKLVAWLWLWKLEFCQLGYMKKVL